MNDFDDRLASSVAAAASFDVADVADRVARRRRRRRAVGAAAMGLVAVAGVGAAVVWLGDDGPDVAAVDDSPTTTAAVSDDPDAPAELVAVAEDPVGADGATGAMSDFHVETPDTFGFVECGANGEPGPPTGERAAELEAVIEDLRDAGLHDQPFIGSSGGPGSIWGVPSVGLSSRYEPTLRWLADRVDPDDVCLEFPAFGLRNLPPELAEVDVESVDGRVVVRAVGCEPKGEWVAPFIRQEDDTVALGIAVGQGQTEFTDDCPAPTTYEFTVAGAGGPGIAAEPGTLYFAGPVGVGTTAELTFDPVNAASGATMGDDLIVQLADDPTVQFQVSDVFSDGPVAGAVGEVATDQWPVTGTGTLLVPEGVPAGTYFVRFIANPELNGTLEVTGPVGDGGDGLEGTAPDWGWTVPDLDGDGVEEQVDGVTGQLRLTALGGEVLVDPFGAAVTVPVDGDHVFTCNPDGRLFEQWDAPIDQERFSRRLAELRVVSGSGEWVPSPSFVFGAGQAPLPPRGQGCEPFGVHPQPDAAGPVADGEVSDVHVEATDLVFPDCPATLDPAATTPERSAELEALRVRLNTDGLTDATMFYSGSSINGGRLQIGLYRRYQPTIDFLAERAAPDDICFFLLPPVGAFTAPPGTLEWTVDESTVGGPDDTVFTVVNGARCGVIYKDLLLPPQVVESDDRVEIAVPLLPRFGPSILPCPEPDRFEITLSAPIGDRDIVPLVGPTVAVVSQLDNVGTVPGEQFTVSFDPAGLGSETTMGDDVMLQSVDDPSVQIQIGKVLTDSPTAGAPAPIVTDRWDPTGQANLLVPEGTPPGDYTFVFIEHPQFWGTLTVV